jgi:hypothetical protein
LLIIVNINPMVGNIYWIEINITCRHIKLVFLTIKITTKKALLN